MDHTRRRGLCVPDIGLRTIGLCIAILTVTAGIALPTRTATGGFVSHNTPSYTATAKLLGAEDPAKVIEVSLWLNPHKQAELDAVAQDLYDTDSPNYRKFLTMAQIAARFAPTAAEAKTVSQFLEAHNLKVVRVGPHNFFVRARGTVHDVQAAFDVQLNQYQLMGKLVRANDRDPFIEGDAASLVRAVYGLDSMEFHNPVAVRPTSVSQLLETKMGTKDAAATATAASTSTPNFFSNNCFLGTETDVFSTNADGEFPIGTYKGNHLNLPSQTSVGCGYTPPMIHAAYDLKDLYANGLDGRGQTIAILDACGAPSIEVDANAFSAKFGLPPLTKKNFAIIDVPPPVTCGFDGNLEVNLDVEWAHAIAPGANINLLLAPSATIMDLDEAEFLAISNHLGTVISGSFGLPEPLVPQNMLETENMLSEMAAMAGISTNFSTGDFGDFSQLFQAGAPQFVSAPASSPFATAVGGISLALNSDNSIKWQAGWGNNLVAIANNGTVFDPPFAPGLSGGSGGGASNCVEQMVSTDPNTGITTVTCLAGFPKPSFQNKLPGTTRQLPDISWLADQFTGGVIVFTVPGVFPPQQFAVIGGTSLSCPMFSALWAIANQAAGRPLGQAAPYLYSLPKEAITDVVPLGVQHIVAGLIQHDVTGSIRESAAVTKTFNAGQMLGGHITEPFVSGIWDDPFIFDAGVVISFDTDCSASTLFTNSGTLCSDPNHLQTTVGWDNVTGLGVPNGSEFIEAFARKPVRED
jgi:subtilase family serine protease